MIFRIGESSAMMKFIYLFFVLFAFIITSCDEQTLCDDTYSDNEYNPSQDNKDDDNTKNKDGDTQLDASCSCDDLNNSIKDGNRSGSRITFKEYHLSDGSIIFDDTPFDTTYNRHCTYATDALYAGLEGCCVYFNIDYLDSLDVSFYNESSCTNELPLLMLSSQPNNSDLVRIRALPYEYGNEYTCGERDYITTYAIITNAYITAPMIHSVYVHYYDSCITWAEYVQKTEYAKCYYLAGYKELTMGEARSLFACEE